MKTTLLFAVSCLLSFGLATQSPRPLIGKWQDQANPEKQVYLYRQPDGRISGKAVSDGRTVKNERLVFKDLEWDDKAEAYTGLLINPDNGSAFKIAVMLPRPDQFVFVVRRFFLSRTFRFVRMAGG